ncbi:MAG: hypothetical protein O2819_07920 [Planctomycetota bacterium]|nr:hypothetical protein [Planctomycetota bacterium]
MLPPQSRLHRSRLFIVGSSVSAACLACAPALAQDDVEPPVLPGVLMMEMPIGVDSQPVHADRTGRIWADIIDLPGAGWVRLDLAGTQLAPGAVLHVTSLLDDVTQRLDATSLSQWRSTSCYLNGGAVLIELFANQVGTTSRVSVPAATVGPEPEGGVATICGNDDRLPSTDPRVARVMPVACTGWLIQDDADCMLSAGHCGGSSSINVAQFNVPFSASGGGLVSPPPEDQYPIDASSQQLVNGGLGNDWNYYGAFPNSNTGLRPHQAQGAGFALVAPPAVTAGAEIRITGHGTDSTPNSTYNQVQQTEVGAYVSLSGTTVRYETDTTGGNSGSPIIYEATDEAIGIHTNGGCGASSGSNIGCSAANAGLQSAIASPHGVCIPTSGVDLALVQALPAWTSPDGGATVQLSATGAAGSTIDPSSVTMWVSEDGGSFQSFAMSALGGGVYQVALPESTCGAQLGVSFSAATTTGEVATLPEGAPAEFFTIWSADGTSLVSIDALEVASGWLTSSALDTAISGLWTRVDPVGTNSQPEDDHSAVGSMCFVTGQGVAGGPDGAADLDGGFATLTSPTLDCTTGPDPHIAYSRWFDNRTGTTAGEDVMRVEVSGNNGATWVLVETVGPNTPDSNGGWVTRLVRVGDFVTPSASVRVRFIPSDEAPQHTVEAAVDDLEVWRAGTPYYCNDGGSGADINGDGIVDGIDLASLLGNWGGTGAGDIDGDGAVGGSDLAALLAAWG